MRRSLKWGLRALAVLPAVAAAVVAGGFLWLRGSLPDLEGNHDIPGLDAPVEVLRDADGLVTIRAAGEADAYRALGYVHAQDRLWQMDFMRRTGAGRLSEVIGPQTLEIDRLMRGLGIYRLAEESLADLSPALRATLEAYAEGVNAFIAEPYGPWPPEFQLLRYQPEPWRPADSLVWGRLMALRLSGNWWDEVLRLDLARRLTPEQIAFLWPPDDGPITITGAHRDAAVLSPLPSGEGGARPPGGREGEGGLFGRDVAPDQGIGPAPSIITTRPHPPAAARRAPPSPGGRGEAMPASKNGAIAALFDRLPDLALPRDASNAWAVSGALTASGKPILANDPHLSLDAPGLWYLARIEAPGLTLAGATVPGVPFHVIGHNGTAAWGFTTTHADTQDLFLERPSEDDPGGYDTPDGPRAFARRAETIAVRGEDPVTMEVRATRHGPVISDFWPELAALLPEGRVAALAWTALAADDRSAEAVYRLNRAGSWDEFLEAMADFHAPVQNVLYADTAGAIGFITAGRLPRRKAGDGRAPVPGWSGEHDWLGLVPFEELPRSKDPPGGLLINANNRVVGPGYPHLITADWPDGHRARRIEQRLATGEAATAEGSRALQLDVTSLAARELTPLLLALLDEGRETAGTTPAMAEARDRLAAWDHSMEADRPEPLIFHAWVRRLNRLILADELGPAFDSFGRARTDLLLAILRGGPSWCDDIGSDAAETCAALVRDALGQALDGLEREQGADMAAWRWGAVHVAAFPHPVLRFVPLVRDLIGFSVETGGDFYTVNRGGIAWRNGEERRFDHVHGPGLRAVFDLADLEASRFMIATGQSGNPLSPLYGGLAERWRDGETLKLVGGETAPLKRLMLKPRR